jgi:hypothetical protein
MGSFKEREWEYNASVKRYDLTQITKRKEKLAIQAILQPPET